MKPLLCLLTVFVCLNASACNLEGSGNRKSEQRALPSFNGIGLRCGANVIIAQGDQQEVRIEADDNLLSKISTEVKNDELVIDYSCDFRSRSGVSIYVTMPTLCVVELTGSGNITATGSFHCEFLNLRLSGSGDIKGCFEARSLKASLAGSGSISLSGSVAESDIRISGSGDVKARDLKMFSSTISITGSGNSEVDVANNLKVDITGSGNVYYLAEPAHLQKRITGSGGVSKA
jgi:hypothetical protein